MSNGRGRRGDRIRGRVARTVAFGIVLVAAAAAVPAAESVTVTLVRWPYT